MDQYYYNLRTKKVEYGQLSPIHHLMGPYDSKQEAERALEQAALKNQLADADQQQWNSYYDEDE